MTIGKIIDGKAFAEGVRAEVTRGVAEFLASQGRTPGLAVVLVGEDAASTVYVRNKGKMTVAVGMESMEFRRPTATTQEELIELVEELNGDPLVDGILVQLPLPDHIDDKAVIAT
ncbi:MAG: tetrahydrofolate dehydrogenase/cyclohydrolase catalytic domain-containing protein, partial [Sphingobium sp.]